MERILGTLTYSFHLNRKAQRKDEEQERRQFEAEMEAEVKHRNLLIRLRCYHAENCVRTSTVCTNGKMPMSKSVRKPKHH